VIKMVKCIDCANWIIKDEKADNVVPNQRYRCVPDMKDMSMSDMKAEQDCNRFKDKIEE